MLERDILDCHFPFAMRSELENVLFFDEYHDETWQWIYQISVVRVKDSNSS